jgi:hypothetical protein
MATKAYSIFLLARAANNLDQRGFHKEASKLDRILYKLADDIAIEPPAEPTQQFEDMAQRLTQALQQLGFVVRNPGTKQPNQITDMILSADGLSRNIELWQQIHDASEFLNVAPEMALSLQADPFRGIASITIGFVLGEQLQVAKPLYLTENQWQNLEISLDDFLQRYLGRLISKRLAQLPKPKKDKQVATNMTERDTIDPSLWDEEKGYRDFAHKLFMRDLIDKYGEEKAQKVADKAVAKQISSHTFFSSMLDDYVDKGGTVVSVGSGFGHEQAVNPNYKWLGLEFQKNLVSMANQRNSIMGLESDNQVWSAWEGEFEEAKGELGEDWEEKLGELPYANAVYLKHACGGLTDSSLYQAIKTGIPTIVIASCCAHRFQGISHKVLAPDWDFADWEKLVKKSSKRQTKDGKIHPEGSKAVEKIDDLRQALLEKHGYVVSRGWQEKDGERTPAGSFIVAHKRGTDDQRLERSSRLLRSK